MKYPKEENKFFKNKRRIILEKKRVDVDRAIHRLVCVCVYIKYKTCNSYKYAK